MATLASDEEEKVEMECDVTDKKWEVGKSCNTPSTVAPPTTSREQVLSCLKNLSKEEYNNMLNEMMTEDF